MNCNSVKELRALYLYGELPAQEEDDFEQHVHACSACRSDLDSEKTLHRGLDEFRLEPPPQLLVECRRELFRARPFVNKPSLWTSFSAMWLALGGAARPASRSYRPSGRFSRMLPDGCRSRSMKPGGAWSPAA